MDDACDALHNLFRQPRKLRHLLLAAAALLAISQPAAADLSDFSFPNPSEGSDSLDSGETSDDLKIPAVLHVCIDQWCVSPTLCYGLWPPDIELDRNVPVIYAEVGVVVGARAGYSERCN